MKQYIDKSALVSEIERLKECNRKICGGDFDFLKKVYPKHYYSTEIYNDILYFLDTLEVKEIDSDKEARHYLLHEHESPLSAVMHQTDLRIEMQYHKDIENAFKAGLKLGLKAQKGDKV